MSKDKDHWEFEIPKRHAFNVVKSYQCPTYQRPIVQKQAHQQGWWIIQEIQERWIRNEGLIKQPSLGT